MHDLKFAFRALFKTPGFTAVAILTIAVAIGSNTALFSIFDRLVLNPLDLPDSGRLVRLWTNNTARNVLFLPTTREQKYAAKQAIDSFFKVAGDVLSGVLVFVGSVLAFAPRHFALVNLGLAAGWLGVALWVGRRYRELAAETAG